jgi:hypothetical protein
MYEFEWYQQPIALPLAAVLPHSCHGRLFFYRDKIRAPVGESVSRKSSAQSRAFLLRVISRGTDFYWLPFI